jgi:CHASE3 domain sensor protein
MAPARPESRIEAASLAVESAADSAEVAAGQAAEEFEAQHQMADTLVDQHIDRDQTVAHNMVGAAISLGLAVIMMILMAIVAGYFVAEAPSDGAFSEAISQIESVGGTAFILLAVALLAIPVVAIVGYFIRSGLGRFISTGGMGR